MIRMRHKTTQSVLNYFNLVRNGESAPLRADIEPQALKTVLPDVFILEIDQPGGFRFRLAGTRVCAILGQEARGTDLLSYFAPAQRHKMKLAAESVLANRSPLSIDVTGLLEGEEPLAYEMLLLPLRSQGDICDRLLGSLTAIESVPRFGDRGRTLEAGRLSFVRGDATEQRPSALADVVISSPATFSLAARVHHLRLLQGGRQD